MKTHIALISLAFTASAIANSTLSDSEKFAHAANFGWINCKPTSTEGVSVGDYYLSGRAYSANVGWITLGSGTPSDQIRWSNTGGSDSGINLDAAGKLSGFAYGANIGWISFEQGSGKPTIDLSTGQFSGYAYGANVGWIDLAGIRTESFAIIDSDGDGIDDPWELERGAGDLTEIGDGGDFDRDGSSDLDEYFADTNPFDAADYLRILSISLRSPTEAQLIWTSRPQREYLIETSADLTLWAGDGTVYAADVEDDVTGATLAIDLNSTPRIQFRVKARRTLPEN